MLNKLVGVLLFAISVTVNADVCDDMLKSNNEVGFFESFIKSISDNYKPKPKESREYYFSNRSGFSRRPKCDASNPGKRNEEFIYYPVGIVYEKIKDESVSIEGRDYIYVRAEYGLKMYMPLDDLEQIKKKHQGYIFVDGSEKVPYCTRLGCSENDFSSNNLYLNSGGGKKRLGRYGVVANVIEKDDCLGYLFFPHEGGKPLTSQSTYLSSCWKVFDNNSVKIRFVNFDFVEKLFDQDFDGNYAAFSKKHFTKIGLQKYLMKKKCNQKHEYNTKGEIKGGGNYYVFSGSISASAYEKTTRPEGRYHYFSFYTLEGNNYPIESISVCSKEFDEPIKAANLRIYHEYIQDEYLDINIQKVINIYKKLHDLGGYAPTESNWLRRGKFFTICGGTEYFNLRDVVRYNLDGMPQIKDILAGITSEFNQDIIKDFYTHLIIASTGRFLTAQNCKKAQQFVAGSIQ